MLIHLDLFSGIGGFALACEWNGIETIGFVEIDKYCQKVLRKHYPNVPIVGDIRDVKTIKEIVTKSQRGRLAKRQTKTAIQHYAKCRDNKAGNPQSLRGSANREIQRAIQPAILITAGFPCQPFSVAGKRQGKDDNRYLWGETIAVIEAIKPRWVLLENVTGIINLALDTVLSDLEGAGYSCETLIIPACAVNAWHRRDRIWIIAYSTNNGLNRNDKRSDNEGQISKDSEQSGGRWAGRIEGCGSDMAIPKGREPRQQTEQEGGQGSDRGSQEVVIADSQREGLEGSDTEGGLCATGQPVQPDTDTKGNRIQGGQSVSNEADSGDWWAVEPELCLLADGLSKELDGGRLNDRTINAGKDSTSFCWGKVRRMWHDCLARGSPHGWRQDKQLARELADILRSLSYPLALAEWQTTLEMVFRYLYRMRQACEAIGALRNPSVTIDEAWQSLSEEDKDWVVMAIARGQWIAEWPNVGRVSKGVKNRVDRLKCLGNAIVPAVASEIIKVIKELDDVQV